MNGITNQPNWGLVTNHYEHPKTFAALLDLLVPKKYDEESENYSFFLWREKEFYKKENIAAFIQYGVAMIEQLPKFHRDEIPVLLRIICMYEKIEKYEEAYSFMEQQQLIQFVHTAMGQEHWDDITKAVAYHYLIIKRKITRLDEVDFSIWEKVKFSYDIIQKMPILFSIHDTIEFTLLYVCGRAIYQTQEQLEADVMELVVYCNTFLDVLYKQNLVSVYVRCVEFLETYCANRAVVGCLRLVVAQLHDVFRVSSYLVPYDFLSELNEIIIHINPAFVQKYEKLLGMFISYIPFDEMIKVPRQIRYFEKLLYLCEGTLYKEDLLRTYIFEDFARYFFPFAKPFLEHKNYQVVYHMLFYWCAPEVRQEIEQRYNLHKLYAMYASG